MASKKSRNVTTEVIEYRDAKGGIHRLEPGIEIPADFPTDDIEILKDSGAIITEIIKEDE
jgi:hypothetical protein